MTEAVWSFRKEYRTRFYRLRAVEPDGTRRYHAAVVDDFGGLVVVAWQY